MTGGTDTTLAPLFYEPGATWYWLLAGPLAGGTMLFIEKTSGYGWQVLVPAVFVVLVSFFVGLQVKAARIHASVELTEHTLRQGTESIPVAEIVAIYPEPPRDSGAAPLRWQSARSLGEVVGVPRGRVGIGLKLAGGRTAQAWARRHRHLRAALAPLVQERVGPGEPDIPEDPDTPQDDTESQW